MKRNRIILFITVPALIGVLSISFPAIGDEAQSLDYADSDPAYLETLSVEAGYQIVDSTDTDLLVAEDGATPMPLNEREWDGDQDPVLRDLSVEIAGITEDFSENLAGSSFSSDDSFLEVYVKDVDGPGIAEIQSAAKSFGMENQVVLLAVDHSLQELEIAAETVDTESDGLLSAGIDFISNGLTVQEMNEEAAVTLGIQSELDSTETVNLDQVIPVEKQLRDGQESIPVEVEEFSPVQDDVGRYDDSSYYYSGARIRGVNGETCSLGIPIVVNGQYKVLTAGHCLSPKFTNGITSTIVGNIYTTAYPHNAEKYGDWKLLQGSHYATRIWNAGANDWSNKSVAITRAIWGEKLSSGTQLCTSGQTTGQKCRFRLKEQYAPVSVSTGNVRTGYHSMMRHQNTVNVNDSNGFQSGDSGGPVYFSNSVGGVTVVGIVKGHTSDSKYYYTRLDGVRKWNGSAYVG